MKWSYKSAIVFLSLLLIAYGTRSQDTEASRFSPKELIIPATPVFDLMNITPSQVNHTSDIKDFKVDWSFKSWKLNPNLAIQSQPIWEMIYNRKELSKYQSASRFMRQLSSLDVSIGTIQDENNDRRIGFAAKVNLFKNRDPLMAKELYTGISERYKKEKEELGKVLKELNTKLDTTSNILEKPEIRNQIRGVEEQLLTQNSRRKDEINDKAKVYVNEYWNATSIDIAAGKVYTYKTDSAGSLKGLKLNRNTGFGAWLNANIGIGKRVMFSALFRSNWYKEQLDFNIKDTVTQEEIQQSAVARNTVYTFGANLRYGGPVYTFFIEILYEAKKLKTPLQALNEVFKVPSSNTIIETSTLKWDVVQPNTLSFGGDWRISRSVSINYGMRCVFDKRWKFKTFTPLATVSCMMR